MFNNNSEKEFLLLLPLISRTVKKKFSVFKNDKLILKKTHLMADFVF